MAQAKNGSTVLVIDDDQDLLELVRDYYRARGYKVVSYDNALIPLSKIRNDKDFTAQLGVVLCDLKMPNFDGMQFVSEVKPIAPDLPIILMTAHSSVELAVSAIKAGAYDFITKPLNFTHLNVALERALQLRDLKAENRALKETARNAKDGEENLIYRSPQMESLIELVKRVAKSNANVLILGESGTGKEVTARSIHRHSSRSNGPFVALNCSAIPETLLESELFGFSKGAFTGAVEKKIGLFEEANGGTLFLDEIGDLSLPLQAKLLRVLQERKIKRVGENTFRPVDVRILSATHKDLRKEVSEGNFREDLFFRLNVISVKIPALRERREDILPLAEHFLKKYAAINNSSVKGFSRAAADFLLSHPWRGNVRELENAVERAVVLCRGELIEPEDLPDIESFADESLPEAASIREGAPKDYFTVEIKDKELPTLAAVTLKYVKFVLDRVDGVKERAARILDIDRKTLYKKISEFQAGPQL